VNELKNVTYDFALARYNPDGSLDAGFGIGGKVTTDFFGEDDVAEAVVIQPDGKIVAAGSAARTSALESIDFALARYNSNGSLDTSFGSGGKVTTDFFGRLDGASSCAIQPNGNIVVGGFTSHGGSDQSTEDFALARYIGDSPAPPVIQDATIQGKQLIVTGLNYDTGAKILVDGEKQKTANDDLNPSSILIARKAGKFIGPGQTVSIQVQNADGLVSDPFSFKRTPG